MATGTAETRLQMKPIAAERQPGHWLLASLGKRVLRPGGRELTQWMLDSLAISSGDRVVEFAPGMGATGRQVLALGPREYIAVERDAAAAARARRWVGEQNGRTVSECVEASADATGLEGGNYSVVYGEAMLTMQTPENKRRIVAEAARLLSPGGRYGIHEMCLAPADISEALQREIQAAMSMEIHVGVQPVPNAEWRQLLEAAGLHIVAEKHTGMRLLEPGRVIRDEGWFGAARIMCNLCRKPAARQRVRKMRAMFRRYGEHLEAVSYVAVK